MVNEPIWKLALNWGVVVTFLTTPLVFLSVQLYLVHHPDLLTIAQQEHFRYLAEFQRNLAILIFGLAGLRTWEQLKNGNPASPTASRKASQFPRLRRASHATENTSELTKEDEAV